jgi:hypothetical protein
MRKASEHEGPAPAGPVAGPEIRQIERGGLSVPRRRSAHTNGASPQDRFHLILQLELALFQCDFFDLLGFGKVMAGGQIVDLLVEVVMLSSELAKLLIGLQKLSLQLFEVCRHFRLL